MLHVMEKLRFISFLTSLVFCLLSWAKTSKVFLPPVGGGLIETLLFITSILSHVSDIPSLRKYFFYVSLLPFTLNSAVQHSTTPTWPIPRGFPPTNY